VTTLLALSAVGKDYAKIDVNGGRLRLVWELLRGHPASNVFRALNDISFELKRGASLGIIGENGAGKSTLLKIIAGVVKPTRGTVRVNGRVGALLELGSGFHPEYTGLANIELAAALLGLGPDEISAKREEIVAFADLGDHIRDPIKHYSSGMIVRLGFAVATALRPDVLVTDEVLAVGDESFQKKCVAWMENYLEEGGTLLLCSHSMYHIQRLCRSALWLDHGAARMYDSADLVAREYLAWHEVRSSKARQAAAASAAGAMDYRVAHVSLRACGTGPEVDADAGFEVDAAVFSPDGRPPVLALGVVRADGTAVYGTTSEIDGASPCGRDGELFLFRVLFHDLPLLPGHYRLRAHAMDPEGLRLYDTHELPFVVAGTTRELGHARMPRVWSSAASDAQPAISPRIADVEGA
jgi:lipopolysaccharide transport system ATP-binding protein